MKNALDTRGTPRLSPNRHYLTYADGTPFFWLADTWWFAATRRIDDTALNALLADRKKKGFTVILLVVGAPPEVDPLSPDAANRGGCAFLPDGQPNTRYFDHADGIIRKIISAGLVPCITGSWGHHIDTFGVEAMKRLWSEIMNRWNDLPVVYCLTGEADIFLQGSALQKFTAKIIQKILPMNMDKERVKQRVEKWDRVARHIKQIDNNNHLLTVHPHRKLLASELFSNPGWLDIDTVQSGHSIGNASFLISSALGAQANNRPFINLEPWYEGILGNFGPQLQRYAFWMSMLSGAAGHTYGAHGIWQMADGDNFMGHWGDSNWKTAKRYPGSTQLGAAKRFLEKYPWWTIEPNPSLITPSWEADNPFRPMAAVDCDGRIWVYCPARDEQTTYRVPIVRKNGTHVTWIDPVTVKPTKEQHVTQPLTFSLPPKTDQLLVIQRPV